LALHLAGMHASSPPGTVFALDLSGLQAPGMTVWSAWRGDRIAGVAALNDLGDGTGEVKSMRTHPDHLRSGVAVALLDWIIAMARRKGLTRLSLETGNGPAFQPALRLYAKRGFRRGMPFSRYAENGHSLFLHLDLCDVPATSTATTGAH
jgi:putative acetyltransferase